MNRQTRHTPAKTADSGTDGAFLLVKIAALNIQTSCKPFTGGAENELAVAFRFVLAFVYSILVSGRSKRICQRVQAMSRQQFRLKLELLYQKHKPSAASRKRTHRAPGTQRKDKNLSYVSP